MPKPLPEFLIYFLSDCLGWDEVYTSKAMFWWHSIYKHGQIFAVYGRDNIFMKVGDNNRQDYIDAGSEEFLYEKNGKQFRMSYWKLPEEILEDREKLLEWIEKSLEVKKK